jgi:hypothetical protein
MAGFYSLEGSAIDLSGAIPLALFPGYASILAMMLLTC